MLCIRRRRTQRADTPMSFGFNTNVRVGEIVYHVQTEQRGADHAVIDTVVYVSGRVIHRVKTQVVDANIPRVGDAERAPNNESPEIRAQVERQHQSIIAQLESGALPANLAAAPITAAIPASPSIAITLNGEPREIPSGLSVATLLDHLALRQDRVAIERNSEILLKSQWPLTPVVASDRFEIVHLVGGG
jgi:sulfur carrier protein